MADQEQQLIEAGLQTEASRLELAEQAEEDENLALEEENKEIEYANQLAAEREAESVLAYAKELYDRGMSFSSPSMVKWGIIFILAILNDVVDLLDITGFGEVFAWIISVGLTGTILLIIWFTDTNMKRAQNYTSEMSGTLENFSAEVMQIENRVMSLAEGTAKRLNKIGFKNIKIRTSPRKNPLTRALMGSALETVPFLGAVNLITVWVFFAYLAERHAFISARETAEEAYAQVSQSAAGMV